MRKRERKADILLELHLRLHAIGHTVLDELEALDEGQARVDAWPGLLARFITEVADHRELMMLHQRNQSAVEELHRSEGHRSANDDIEQQFRRLLSTPSIPIATRVRMACSIGAVVGGLVGTGALFDDASADQVVELVRGVVGEMFAPETTPAV